MRIAMSRPIIIAASILLLGITAVVPFAQENYVSVSDRQYTNVNKIGLMINNNGFLGTNLPNEFSPPSFEFPLGTDYERMVRGGIWVGAINNNGDRLVSTGTISGIAGGDLESEFRDGPLIEERSSLRNSPFYDPEAVSEQDLVLFFDDLDETILSGHEPMKIQVDLRTYAWSFEPVNQFVILSYTIKNIGRERLQDIYIGMYAELIACNKQFDGFSGICWDTKHLEYYEDQRLVGCHFHLFNQTLIPGWGGYNLLGSHPDSIAGKTITFDWWEWTSDEGDREQDVHRYERLTSGVIDGTVTDGAPDIIDPVELLSVGPYRFLYPGDTLNVVFAFVGGNDREDFKFRGEWAQKTFDSNYQIPEPPPSPNIHVDPGPNSVNIFWEASPETIPDPVLPDSLDFQGYRVYISRDNVEYTLVGDYDLIDTIGFNTGLEPVTHESEFNDSTFNYHLEVPNLKDGFQYYVAVTSYDRGDKASGVPSLESGFSQNRIPIIPGPEGKKPGDDGPGVVVFPNPYRGEGAWDGRFARDRLLYFANLPRLCTIRIYTIAGDLVDTIEFDSDTYHGTDVSAIYDPDLGVPELSGGIAAWDLLTREDQSIASGLYVFSVENRETGDMDIGKFMVIR